MPHSGIRREGRMIVDGSIRLAHFSVALSILAGQPLKIRRSTAFYL